MVNCVVNVPDSTVQTQKGNREQSLQRTEALPLNDHILGSRLRLGEPCPCVPWHLNLAIPDVTSVSAVAVPLPRGRSTLAKDFTWCPSTDTWGKQSKNQTGFKWLQPCGTFTLPPALFQTRVEAGPGTNPL